VGKEESSTGLSPLFQITSGCHWVKPQHYPDIKLYQVRHTSYNDRAGNGEEEEDVNNKEDSLSEILAKGMWNRRLNRSEFLRFAGVGTSLVAFPQLLLACSQQASEERVAKDEPKPKFLRLLYVGVEANVEAMRYAAEKYRREKNIRVEIESFPQTAMREKLFSELSSQSPYYDVVLIDHPWGAATAPHLLNLQPLVVDRDFTDPKLLAANDFIPQTWAQVVYDQENTAVPPMEFQLPDFFTKGPMDFNKMAAQTELELLGIPFHPNVLTMAYRKDYFDDPQLRSQFEGQFGRELAPPANWDEYVEVTTFFTKSHNPDSPTEYGATLMAKKHESLYTDWRTWNRSFGVVEINEKLEPTFNNEPGIRATTFYKDLINKHKVVPPAATTWTWDEVTTAFGSGQTAIAMNYHRMELDPEVVNQGGEVGFAPVPGEVQSDGAVIRAPHYGTYYLAVNRYSEKPRWAYDLILNVTSPQWQKEYSKFLFHGSRTSYYEDPNTIETRPEYWPTFFESLKTGYARPRISVYVEYSETIQAEISRYLLGDQDVETALNNAANGIRELFERNKYYEQI
jgi:multiple sugar transport system substrate-binding protein